MGRLQTVCFQIAAIENCHSAEAPFAVVTGMADSMFFMRALSGC